MTTKLANILHCYAMGMGIKGISATYELSRNTVRKYVRLFQESGIPMEQLQSMSVKRLEEMFGSSGEREPNPSVRQLALEALLPEYAARLTRKGVTVKSLYQEYRREHPNGFRHASFGAYIQRYRLVSRPVGHVEHYAADQMYIDFAGDRLQIIGEQTGEVRSVEVFVAILPCSHYTYCEAVWSQKKEDLIKACENVLHFYGGVPMAIVPDNLKSGVTRSDRNEPIINEDFTRFAESIRYWNNKPDAPCIFPYVLYGLLPKVADEEKEYTAKDIWDDTVRLGVDDFAPSVNCMQFIERLFAGQKQKLGGTALDDVRLRKLYMSYKNPTEYQMPWNYGKLGKVALSVEWSNYRDRNKEKSLEIERTMVQNRNPKSSPTGAVYNADLLSAVNSKVQIRDNPGENIRKVEVLRYAGRPFTAYRIFIPYSGLYKIRLSGSIALYTPYLSGNFVLRSRADGKDIRVIQPSNNNLAHWRYELKLIRDGGKGDFNLESCDIDREFYKDNINQTPQGEDSGEVYPKYFPHGGELCYIDPAQNPNLLCGLSFGKKRDELNPNPYVAHLNTPPEKKYSNAIAIKGGLSWNHEVDRMVVAATASRGYGECYRDEDDQIAYEESERFKVDLQNCPGENTATTDAGWTRGEGSVYQIAWLDKGECITLLASCDQSKNEKDWHGAAMQNIEADLEIEAYRSDEDWVLTKINADGESLPGTTMDWEDKSNLETDKINLMKFLPSDITIDSWLENFCKAFNLKLTQDDKGNFGLDTAPDGTQYGGYVIDLDSKTHVNRERTNSSLNLPSAYQISFNIDTDEEGYVRGVVKDADGNVISTADGSGQIDTGNADGKPFAQHSSFSYNWFKNIKIAKYDNKEYRLPVISKHEVWKFVDTKDYAAMIKKYYSNQPQRFWYKGDNLEVSGFGDAPVETTLVRNDLPQLAELTYRDQSLSILNNYFTILAKNNSNYTEVKCILAADEYARLAESLVLYNGDLYYPAEIDGYDPLGKSAATLKLIRKIN